MGMGSVAGLHLPTSNSIGGGGLLEDQHIADVFPEIACEQTISEASPTAHQRRFSNSLSKKRGSNSASRKQPLQRRRSSKNIASGGRPSHHSRENSRTSLSNARFKDPNDFIQERSSNPPLPPHSRDLIMPTGGGSESGGSGHGSGGNIAHESLRSLQSATNDSDHLDSLFFSSEGTFGGKPPCPADASSSGDLLVHGLGDSTRSLPKHVGSPPVRRGSSGLSGGHIDILGSTHARIDSLGSTHGRMDSLGSAHGRIDSLGSMHGRIDSLGSTHGHMDSLGSAHGGLDSLGSTGFQLVDPMMSLHAHNDPGTIGQLNPTKGVNVGDSASTIPFHTLSDFSMSD